MSKNVAIFIDVANLYYSARGQDVDVDYVALLKHATKGRDLIRAYAYSGLDPENENQRKFLDFLSKNGYKVVHKDIRKFGDGRVKANLDIELVVDLFRLAPRMDIAVIISGDGDFASAIRALQDIGVRCEVISFRPNTSSDLIAVADEFTDIMKILGIGRKKGEKGISMPEMPAKEVNPEFGFREASRGVAAAALAALREGETPAGRSRRGRRSPAPVMAETVPLAIAAADEGAPELSAEPVEPMTAVEAHVDGANGEQGRRRRRRRGGRGRGRGRRAEGLGEGQGEAPAEGVLQSADSPEVEWQEFDDISQLGLTDLGEPGGEREFAFEEADPQTLAELGIEPQAAAQEAARADAATDLTDAGAPEAAAASGARRGARGTRGGGRRRQPATPTAEADTADATSDATTGPRAASRRTAGGKGRTTTARPASRRGKGEAEASASSEEPRPARSRSGGRARSQTSADQSADAAESKPAPRRRTSGRAGSKAAAPAEATNTGSASGAEAGDEEGIWQRFRSGRRTTGGAA